MMTKSLAYMATALTFAGALALASSTWAEETTQVSGKSFCKTVEQHALPLEGDPDHVLIAEKFTCRVESPSTVFNGGQQAGVDIADLVKGSGPVRGHIFNKFKGGSGYTNITGFVSTEMREGNPHTTVTGVWEFTSGTVGAARGTYRIEPTSQTESVVEWQGTLAQANK
jgi:hypothetical protein